MEQPTLFEGSSLGKHPDRIDRVPVAQGAHQAVIDGWTRLWKERHHVAWIWTPRDLAAVKQVLKVAKGDVAAILERAKRLLFSPPSAWYEQEAAPWVLASRWNPLGLQTKRTAGPGLVNQPRPRKPEEVECRVCSYRNPVGARACQSCGRYFRVAQ